MSALRGEEQLQVLADAVGNEDSGAAEFESRPRVQGKFLFVGERKFFAKGVTYGAFRPNLAKIEFHDAAVIDRDFKQMAANGINTVRIPHTMPPRELLDIAYRHGLRVMVGLSAEQYVGYLSDSKKSPDVSAIIREKVRICAGHPALLCYAIGNEIPAPTARWLGRAKVERYLSRICRVIKAEDPEGLVTYVNYPSTEYLDLPFLDIVSFNVYLEDRDRLAKYLGRLQNIAGARPLIMSEIGLDSMRNGERAQASVLDWQIRTTFESGCAGAFVFSWTDEWFRGGEDVDDWEFGLTRRDRSPKPALFAVRQAFAESPAQSSPEWPRVSVVVCSYNGGRTIRDCLEGLAAVRYSNFEVIVVDDGSTDNTAAIAAEYPVQLIRTENMGLSNARNLGWRAATGEIVAYTDDDAYPDPDWLTYLASAFQRTDYVGIGGPNIPPPGDGAIAECVANSPGGPVHVLLSDSEAEHIPGCNMAFRRSALDAVGGFDTQFRVAGDDVDICWKLQERGWKLGFAPAAQVWHHSRNSVRTFWRQQKGYGKAEAMLEKKWPEKYNAAGHPSWAGRVYSDSAPRIAGLGAHVFFGQWCSAPFQLLYQSQPGTLRSLCLMPEWYLVNLTLLFLSALGFLWTPMLLALPALLVCAALPVLNVCSTVARARYSGTDSKPSLRILTALLHMMQPLARLYGRLAWGLTPWRGRSATFVWPFTRKPSVWTSRWQDPVARLTRIEAAIRAGGRSARRGGDFDRWDLEVFGGLLGRARLIIQCEDGVEGHQFVRFRIWPKRSIAASVFTVVLTAIAIAAGIAGQWIVANVLAICALLTAIGIIRDTGGALATLLQAAAPQLAENAAPKSSPEPAETTAQNAGR